MIPVVEENQSKRVMAARPAMRKVPERPGQKQLFSAGYVPFPSTSIHTASTPGAALKTLFLSRPPLSWPWADRADPLSYFNRWF
jgi:hypothetical protein